MNVFVRAETELKKIDLKRDVLYLNVIDKVPYFHTVHGVFYQIVTIDDYESLLKPFRFFRLDQTHLINMNKIEWIDYDNLFIYFECGVSLEMSRRGKKKLMRYLGIK